MSEYEDGAWTEIALLNLLSMHGREREREGGGGEREREREREREAD